MTVGASLLAKNANDNAGHPIKRGVLAPVASKPPPTLDLHNSWVMCSLKARKCLVSFAKPSSRHQSFFLRHRTA
ncbi:hypothetical protein C1Y30_04920 [Pseudomonas sp. GW704-F3]|nr:hypothetical protein C1Y30_04920 [Pseudomonas sp. GW704-F3]PMU97148.1 hypothetical protein C1Y28_02485 [Pseudomonas sp. GW704-F5]PMV04593.1 hypothetical protein C1Y29_11825 [Pseudomonas sp. MPBD4-3]PMV34143.1 hypothetical protein C1Y27_07405 [Pseudomonas sp. GW704-F2]